MNVSYVPPSPERIADALIKALDERGRHPSQYDVFLSYATSDASIATDIRDALNEKGLLCFMSAKELKGGDNFGDVICNALRNSREVCVLFTPHSAKSEWVLTEWGAAWALKKRIVPIIHRTDIDSLPDRLKSKHVIDFSNLKTYVEQVRDRRSP